MALYFTSTRLDGLRALHLWCGASCCSQRKINCASSLAHSDTRPGLSRGGPHLAFVGMQMKKQFWPSNQTGVTAVPFLELSRMHRPPALQSCTQTCKKHLREDGGHHVKMLCRTEARASSSPETFPQNSNAAVCGLPKASKYEPFAILYTSPKPKGFPLGPPDLSGARSLQTPLVLGSCE